MTTQNIGASFNPEDDWEDELDGTPASAHKEIIVKEVPIVVAKPKTFERVFTFSDRQSADNFVNRKNYKSILNTPDVYVLLSPPMRSA